MNIFIEEYIQRLQEIKTSADVTALYRWFWERQGDVRMTVNAINATLHLKGEYALKADLPCLSVGGTSGLLVLSANPGWHEVYNHFEDEHSRKSAENYCTLMASFFEQHPQVIGRRIRWWSKPLAFVRLLPAWQERFGEAKTAAERWAKAHSTGLVGGWELFPFHSQSDSFTRLPLKPQCPAWLAACMKESLFAALRLSPEVLFVASKAGCDLIRSLVDPKLKWESCLISPGKSAMRLFYLRASATTEIVAIPYQMFSAPRQFTNTEVFAAVELLRLKS